MPPCSAASETDLRAPDRVSDTARSPPVARTRWDLLRKLGAVLIVLTSLTVGLIGLGLVVDEGRAWAVLLIAATPVGIWAALQVTPEGGTSGYCDQNL